MDKLQQSVDAIHSELAVMKDDNIALSEKIKSLEISSRYRSQQGLISDISESHSQEVKGHSQQPTDSAGTASGLENLDIQGEFTAIKDTLVKVKLPSDYKIPDSKTGVKAQFSHHATVVQRCAKYAETGLKIVQLLENSSQPITKADLHDLTVVHTAQIRYLQEEFASIVVESKYGHDTATTFRSLQRNVSVFPQAVIDNVQTAVQLQSLPASSRGDSYRGRGGGYSRYGSGPSYNFSRPFNRGRSFRGRGRPNYYNNYNSGFDPYGQSSPYSPYMYNNIPSFPTSGDSTSQPSQ